DFAENLNRQQAAGKFGEQGCESIGENGAAHLGERPLISRQQSGGGAQVDDHGGFDESECGGEQTGADELQRTERQAMATPAEPGCERNQQQKIHPPGLGEKLEALGHEPIVWSLRKRWLGAWRKSRRAALGLSSRGRPDPRYPGLNSGPQYNACLEVA